MKPRPVALSGVDSGFSSASRRHHDSLAIHAPASATSASNRIRLSPSLPPAAAKAAPATSPPDAENSR